MLRSDRRIRRGCPAAAAPQPGEGEPKRRVPGRLAGLVRPGHDRHPGREIEPLTVERPKCARHHVRDAHLRPPRGRGVPRAHAGR